MRLKNKKIAMFIEDIFEDMEFWYPYYRMKEEGAEVNVLAPKKMRYSGKNGTSFNAQISVYDEDPHHYDALIIPGGYAPDRMRRTTEMVSFLKKMHQQEKLIAAICHAGWMLASAGIVKNRKLTSFFSIKDDMINAGANWVDEPVVRDGNIITARIPDDLPVFCQAIIKSLT